MEAQSYCDPDANQGRNLEGVQDQVVKPNPERPSCFAYHVHHLLSVEVNIEYYSFFSNIKLNNIQLYVAPYRMLSYLKVEMKPTAEALQLPTPAQCRAARSALSLTVLQAAHLTGVSHASIVKIEAGGEVRASVVERLRQAFEARGVTFAPDGRGVNW